jgi:5-methylcytosine-specific restriction enzyme A
MSLKPQSRHAQQFPKRDDRRLSSQQRGYTNRWEKARAIYLANNPLCVECEKHGVTKAAEVVDHIDPHRGDMTLFWDVDNWQSLCKRCHDQKTRRGE